MSIDIDDRYVALDTVEDAETGFRLHTDHDEVYEAMHVENVDVRIYGADDRWHAKIRLPTADLDDAYDTFNETTQALDDVYGTDLFMPATTFLDTVNADDAPRSTEGAITVRYNETGAARHPTVTPEDAEQAALIGAVGSAGASGAAAGAAFMGGTPETLAIGAAGGALAGAAAAGAYWLANPKTLGAISDTLHIDHQTAAIINTYNRFQADDADRLHSQRFLDAVNEKHRLDAVADTTENLDEARRYQELREEDVDGALEDILVFEFEALDLMSGVNATYTAEQYEDAHTFAAVITGADLARTDRPSILTQPDVFKDIFEAAHRQRQEELVQQVHTRGASDAIEAYLDEAHPDLVERTGQEQALKGDTV